MKRGTVMMALVLFAGVTAQANDGGIAVLKAEKLQVQNGKFGSWQSEEAADEKDRATVITLEGANMTKLMQVLPSEGSGVTDARVVLVKKDSKTGKEVRKAYAKGKASRDFMAQVNKTLSIESDTQTVLINCQAAEFVEFTDQGDFVYKEGTPKCTISLYNELPESDAFDFEPSKVAACKKK